jgi:hypothetical protein
MILLLLTLVSATPQPKIGIAAWCNVNKNDGVLVCNYDTKEECEAYAAEDEVCVKNPRPGVKE